MAMLYNLIFIIILILYIPFFIFKNKRREGIRLRIGFYPKGLQNRLNSRKNIWLHAVSVGEVMAASSLIMRLRQLYPDYRLVITTVTETGYSVAKNITKDDEEVLFLPFDISFIVRKVFSYINPHLLIIMETEIWPNLISQAYNNKVGIILLNGRISDTSYNGYMLLRLLIRPILKKIALFLMQADRDRDRIVSLGADPRKVNVVGNLKFDSSASFAISDDEKAHLRSLLAIKKEERLLVAGSTHPKEEEVIIDAYRRIKMEFENLRLLIAPRHIERLNELKETVLGLGFNPILVSGLSKDGEKDSYAKKVGGIFLLDAVGRLKAFYSIADIVFVGGSLVKKGGQNMIEPAVFAKPILFGQYTFNFRDVAGAFIENEAAILILDKRSLEDSIRMLLGSDEQCVRLGERAKNLVENNRGAVDRALNAIAKLNILGRHKSA